MASNVRWTPEMRQVAMRESCSYKRPRNRSSHETVTAEAQRDVQGEGGLGGAQGRVGELAGEFSPSQIHAWKKALLDGAAGVFESGSDRADKISELYRQIGQLKVENDFLARRLGK